MDTFLSSCPVDLLFCGQVGNLVFSVNSRVKFYTALPECFYSWASKTPKTWLQQTPPSDSERKITISAAFKACHIEHDLFFLYSKQLAYKFHILWLWGRMQRDCPEQTIMLLLLEWSWLSLMCYPLCFMELFSIKEESWFLNLNLFLVFTLTGSSYDNT